eukprot:CAMPEP_0204392652 /NCGR_PEP_ID=MMETSP0469-20131031/61870_1 /ASSEMBLY_ACC=CAM_ASM_000384 /TAXON_ID=2969 /ORGANISM="Oxyrrhis marina" /LENGTH=63 /DNA_ID=CAMNT_0051386637 /DNA_START=224 /DNA_END=412 /DNA_ORIENTATION=+
MAQQFSRRMLLKYTPDDIMPVRKMGKEAPPMKGWIPKYFTMPQVCFKLCSMMGGRFALWANPE